MFGTSNIFFIGDTHGLNFYGPVEKNLGHLKNFVLIHVGDVGVGFDHPEREKSHLRKLNTILEKTNSRFYTIRGNHDDPAYFSKDHWINKLHERITFLQDYSTLTIENKLFQFVGGAISIDRYSRIPGRTWWQCEEFVCDESLAAKVDVLVTHTAPTRCFPIFVGDNVKFWVEKDNTLLSELVAERKKLDKIFSICNPVHHFYGHFHNSHKEMIDGCLHTCLDINEISQFSG